MRLLREGQVRERRAILASFSLLLFVERLWRSGKTRRTRVLFFGARSSVLKIFSDDENIALVAFALKNSSSLEAMR